MTFSSPLSGILEPGTGSSGIDGTRSLLKAFAGLEIYRSAVVDELVLDRDFCRRPLRPDDLDFIDFTTPLTTETTSSLSALATQRMLLCANESDWVHLPPDDDEGRWSRFREFYSERNRGAGAVIRPFLERHAFDYLGAAAAHIERGPGALLDAIERETDRCAVIGRQIDALASMPHGDLDLSRIELVQVFGLAATKLYAIDRMTNGWLSAYDESASAARLLVDPLRRLDHDSASARVGASLALHACWQFYLPCSMAVANLLHQFARGARPFMAVGVLLSVAVAFNEWLRRQPDAGKTDIVRTPGRFANLVNLLVTPLAEAHGSRVWDEVHAGFATGALAHERADADLFRQVTWLSGLDDFRRLARQIQDTIEREGVAIDRETFVEPRAMCSTTHVHDDHRLVVVESGEMVFWALPGMQLRIPPGDLVLVPAHRLHGSSVLTDECVYHQPIIPEEWFERLTGEAGYAVC